VVPTAPAAAPATAAARPAENALRKQTLLGLAPVVAKPPAEQAPAASAAETPSAEPAASVPSIVTAAVVATDAPTASDVAPSARADKKPQPAEPAAPAATLSSSYNEVPALRPKRPRWLMPLGVAAAIGLGVVGLRSLDRPPTPTPASLARPITKAKPGAKLNDARPKNDDDDDGDDGDDPSTGHDSNPDPTPPEPDPLKAKPAAEAPPAPAAAEAAAPAAAVAAAATPSAVPAAAASAAADAPVGGMVHINIVSDPPGARMFWKGKEVGTTPFVLEFQGGERHAYEVGLPGYTTRKVVIDGSKTEIAIGLRPDPGSGFGSSR